MSLADRNPAPPSAKALDQVISLIDEIQNRASGNLGRLCDLADRVLGCVPQSGSAAADKVRSVPNGALALLQDRLKSLNSLAIQQDEVIARLERIA